MKHDSRKKARKHRAMKFNPGANPMTGADLGGFNNAASFRGGQSSGQGGGPQVGDWPYNGRQDARKSKSRKKGAHKHESRRHEAHKHAGKDNPAFGTPEWRAKYHKKGARKHGAAKLPHLKPKGKVGKAQTRRLNRNFKTGGFNKIAKSAGREYGSSAAGKRVAGAIFHKMAESRGNAARKSHRSKKSYAHKGHTHRSHKAMKAC